MKKDIIRPLVICVFQKDESILVAEGFDPVKGDHYYRPIGGGIEYGERSADALIREVREEIDADIYNLIYIGTVENIFTLNGELGHEIVQVYDASFTDPFFNDKDEFEGREDNGEAFKL
ncbi:NUDIX domain-containing protein [Salicibibacter cibarius]|uniref:NUDIX domain-containing protein n=1 Tax=Salicibibacter cibarius TaxID=2743000 RepID=A0A7T6Z682_9BACI|nr:NUDIX domain-containing protein [Salicibibacter cibarius]QQK77649.1 NUDIX domain-containing protein [Salicibibacter cibarius]